MTHMRWLVLALILLAAACAHRRSHAPSARARRRSRRRRPRATSARCVRRRCRAGARRSSSRACAPSSPAVRGLARAREAGVRAARTALPPGDEARGARVLRGRVHAVRASCPPRRRQRADHRLLRADHRRQPHADRAASAIRSSACPTISSWSISARSARTTRRLRLRGRLEGRRLVPYWSRARDRARAARAGRAGDRVDERSGGALLPADPGLGAGAARRTASACASAMPTRTAIPTARSAATWSSAASCRSSRRRCRASRHGRRRNPAQAAGGAQRESELRVLPRAADRTDGPIGALGVPLTPERSLAVDRRFDSARRAGLPRDHAPLHPSSPSSAGDGRAGHRRRDPRRRARPTSSGERGPDAGAQAGRMRQQGAAVAAVASRTAAAARRLAVSLRDFVEHLGEVLRRQAGRNALAVRQKERRRAVHAERIAQASISFSTGLSQFAGTGSGSWWLRARGQVEPGLGAVGRAPHRARMVRVLRPDHRIHEHVDGDVVDLLQRPLELHGNTGQ